MANFMGPMAPPQAAPAQPAQLDIRTNPSQRAQFKSFMQGMKAQPTTAPIAPMLPAPTPSPMDQVDIFAPVPMADGGVVGGLNDLQKMSGQMVEALNTVVYGGGQGGGFGDSMSAVQQPIEYGGSADLMQTPPTSLPFAQPLRPSVQDAYAQAQADARRQREGGFMGRVKLPGEMSFDDFAEGYNYRLNNPMPQLQTFANGGVADPYAVEGKIGQSVGPKMVGGTTNVIDASGSNPISSMDDVEMGMANPPLPVTGTGALVSSFGAFLDRKLDRDFAEMDRMAAMGNALRASTPMAKVKDFASGIMDATRMQGPMGSTFSIDPVARDGNLGIMANFSMPFEDGGPVGMFLGGDPQAYGEERGRQDTSETARERVGGTTNVFEGDSAPGGGGDDGDSVSEAIAAAVDAELLGMSQDAQRAASAPVDLTFGAPRTDTSGRFTGTDTDEFFANQNMATDQEVGEIIESIAVDKTRQFDDALNDLFVDPVAAPIIDPRADVLSITPMEQFALDQRAKAAPTSDPYGMPGDPDPALIQEQAFDRAIGNMFATPVTYKTARGNVTGTALDDLNRRMGGNVDASGGQTDGGFMGLGKVAVDALLGIGRGKAEDIFTNIEAGRPGVINARTGQITGYVGDGPFGTKTHTGFGPSPFDANVENVEFDPNRNAYIVTPRIGPGPQEDAQSRNRALPTAPPTTDSTDATPPPPMVSPPTTGLPPSVPDVLVPSTRRDVPVTVPNILPGGMPGQGVDPTLLPQSFLDLLASFNRPAPRAMQDGGAVLDQAADNFLEALKVA